MRGIRGRGRGRGRPFRGQFRGGWRGSFHQVSSSFTLDSMLQGFNPNFGPEGYEGYEGYGPGDGFVPGWGAPFVEEPKDEDEITTAEAEEEYSRVFAECLENNFDLDIATKTAKRAMRAALGIVDSEDEDSEEGVDPEECNEEEEAGSSLLGIVIVTPPSKDGGKPGHYKCEVRSPCFMSSAHSLMVPAGV